MAEDFTLDDEQEQSREIELKPSEIKMPTPIFIEEIVKRKNGRPSGYNEVIADYICGEIENSIDGLRKICERAGIDYSTMRVWLNKHPEFHAQYVRAKQAQADNMFEEIFNVLDEDVEKNDMAAVQTQRTKVDALKWGASKLLPKVYGDKQQVEHTVDATQPMTEQQFKIFMEMQMKQAQLQLNQGERNGSIEDADIVG